MARSGARVLRRIGANLILHLERPLDHLGCLVARAQHGLAHGTRTGMRGLGDHPVARVIEREHHRAAIELVGEPRGCEPLLERFACRAQRIEHLDRRGALGALDIDHHAVGVVGFRQRFARADELRIIRRPREIKHEGNRDEREAEADHRAEIRHARVLGSDPDLETVRTTARHASGADRLRATPGHQRTGEHERARDVDRDAQLARGAELGQRDGQHHERGQQGQRGRGDEEQRRLRIILAARDDEIRGVERDEGEHGHRAEGDRNAAPHVRAEDRRIWAHHRELAARARVRGMRHTRDERAVKAMNLAIEVLDEIVRRDPGEQQAQPCADEHYEEPYGRSHGRMVPRTRYFVDKASNWMLSGSLPLNPVIVELPPMPSMAVAPAARLSETL